ncbi:hypothetical protein [Dyadobacter sediminis]|uniref:Lipoprotein n=1 Tax=Dyadobacter sediminis TaxID=1493691 RepID=A0A5R9KFH0_9BACT|nr:hypothetical protein [Dyadobacter sediminis]TLU94859.1 hypothetical protein FEM55_11630 [Dyadobacter sediminis]GGB87354.1 hypothetical protein GCM10011325_13660 [Dyadobacter sediminis]
MKNMDFKGRLLSFLAVTVLVFALSCQKEDPKPDCGCDGKTYKKVENAKAVYHGLGTFTIAEEASSGNIYTIACEADSTWQKSADLKIPDYIISGNLKSNCSFGPTLIALPDYIQITAIKKQ